MNESTPLNPASGVYVIPSSVALITAVPFVGVVTDVTVSGSNSASVSLNSTSRLFSAVSDEVMYESSNAIGAVFVVGPPGSTISPLTVRSASPNPPSVSVSVSKLSPSLSPVWLVTSVHAPS